MEEGMSCLACEKIEVPNACHRGQEEVMEEA